VTSDDLPHGFTLAAAGVQRELLPMEFTEVKHTFTEQGEYAFQCHVYCGGGHEGMHGKVIVEAP
jgi:cytochrome c oxidase subunit 2